MPDLAGRVGLRHFSDGSAVAVMVGGSIPLASPSINRGNVAQAQAEQAAVAASSASATLALKSAL